MGDTSQRTGKRADLEGTNRGWAETIAIRWRTPQRSFDRAGGWWLMADMADMADGSMADGCC